MWYAPENPSDPSLNGNLSPVTLEPASTPDENLETVTSCEPAKPMNAASIKPGSEYWLP